jgi:hypothetical protein
MNFVNVGRKDGQLNTGIAPILATAYSDVFQVFSAKKFPGVIESTSLSKCFATQGLLNLPSPSFAPPPTFAKDLWEEIGIKIPIRRDKTDGPDGM